MNERISTIDFYKKSSIHGLKWTGITEFLIRIFQFAVTIALARILNPIDFGLITLAFVFIKFVQLVLDFGISAAIIQNLEITEKEYDYFFTLLFILSLVSAAVLFINAGNIALLLDNQKIETILKYLILIIPINGMTFIPRVILMRNLDFKRTSLLETYSAFALSAVTIISAVILKNVWCFVLGTFAEQIILLFLSLKYSKWKPALHFSITAFKKISRFSSSVFATRLVNFFNLNMLNILINKFFGSITLGFFSLAYQIIELPTQRIAKNILKVLYPVLSKLQHQSKEYENLLLNFLLLMLILILPFYAVLFLMAEPFIVIFYGQKWLAAIPILQVLCFAGIFRSLWTMVSAIVMSIGKPQFEFQLNSLIAVCLIPGMYALKSTGLLSLIIYFTVLLGLTYAYANYKIIKMLKISWKQILRKIRVPILATLILFVVVLILTNGIMPMDNQYIFTKFMILLAVSITVYIGAVYVLDSSLFLNLIKIVFKK